MGNHSFCCRWWPIGRADRERKLRESSAIDLAANLEDLRERINFEEAAIAQKVECARDLNKEGKMDQARDIGRQVHADLENLKRIRRVHTRMSTYQSHFKALNTQDFLHNKQSQFVRLLSSLAGSNQVFLSIFF